MVSIRLNRGMESNNVPKGFEKFKIFRDLITDIALLIKNLEQNLKIKLNQNKPSNSSLKDNLAKSTLGSRIKKIWPFRGVFEAHRASLSDYLEYNNNINKFLDEIVLESTGRVNLIEQYDQIADVINKFKIDASGIFRKYSQQLQPEYDRERENFIKNTGIPDPVSDKEIEDAHKSRSSSPLPTDSGKEKQKEFEDNIENLFKILIEKDIDPFNVEEIKEALGEKFTDDLWLNIDNYAKKNNNLIFEFIKKYSPKIIKPEVIKRPDSEGKTKLIVPNWQEIVSKNKEEFYNNWPMKEGKKIEDIFEKIEDKKATEMSEIEKLQHTLVIYEKTNDEIFDYFLNPYIEAGS